MLVIALLCVPLMLLVRPCVLSKKADSHAGAEVHEDAAGFAEASVLDG
jgi:hypothetical protein